MNAVLIIDKAAGLTSHDVVNRVRRILQERSVGHLGTLDPLATGVLPLVIGNLTRLARFYTSCEKTYAGTIRFGFATDTYDSEGQAQGPDLAPALNRAQLEKLASERIGLFQQMPPAFSAKKIHGRPAYELARKNQPVELKPVEVELFEYSLTSVEGSVARFVIECSSGTYIRSLAHEMGQQIGGGAHLTEICRTAVGEFSLEQTFKLEDLAAAARNGEFQECVIPLEGLLPNFPSVHVLPVVEHRVRHGSKFNILLSQLQPGRSETMPGATMQLDGGVPRAPRLRVFGQQQKLIAIAEARVPRTYQPIVVFDPLP